MNLYKEQNLIDNEKEINNKNDNNLNENIHYIIKLEYLFLN